MPAIVPLIIIWVCVVAFILCVIGGLLILFERWTPRNNATRRWLVGGLLVSIVGGVSGFASQQFRPGQPTAPATLDRQALNVPTDVGNHVAPTLTTDPPPATPRNSPNDAGSPSQDADAATPATVTDWAEATLGPRPLLAPTIFAAYPGCVASLASQSEETVLSADVDACRHELTRMHSERILPVYNLKAPYERKLEQQEEGLRSRHLESETLPRYSYVLAEMERLRGARSARFVALDRRLQDDIANCFDRRCRASA
jgi:hypothetical protein